LGISDEEISFLGPKDNPFNDHSLGDKGDITNLLEAQ